MSYFAQQQGYPQPQQGAPAGGVDPQQARDHYQGREIKIYGQQQAQFDGSTTHKTSYVGHPLEPRPQVQRGQYQGSNAPFDGTTSYGSQYVQHPLEPRAHGHVNEYRPSAAPFDGTSTYASQYTAHPMEPRVRGQAQHMDRPNIPFDGTSTYKDNYHQHPMPDRPNAGQPYQHQSVPFEGQSTYKDQYPAHAMEARPQYHGNAAARPSLPFDGATTYGDTFKPYPILPREGGQRAQYAPSGAPFEGQSETMDKYRAWAIDPANRRGGGPPPMRPSLPFEGTTTNRELFKGWQLPPKRPALGVQLVGDVAYILIPADAPVPAVGRQVFTTVHDNQRDMSFLVLEGDFSQASRCNVLGQFDMQGIPGGRAGAARVEVTFHVDQGGVLSVSAVDLDSQRQEMWLREGVMVAHV